MTLRFRIAGLLGLIVACGLGLAALRNANELWASLVFSATLGFLAVAGLGAALQRGARRAFWLGALGFGGGYVFLCFGPWCSGEIRPLLVTTRGFKGLHEALYPPGGTAGDYATLVRRTYLDLAGRLPEPSEVREVNQFLSVRLALGTRAARTPEPLAFEQVGHGLTALLLALLGGGIAVRLDRNRDGHPDPAP